MDKTEIIKKLKDFIEKQDNIVIEDANQRLDIDSYTMMLIIMFVDEDIGVQLDMDTLDFDAFLSLDTFASIVLQEASKTAAE
jgi:acyl carrier protein